MDPVKPERPNPFAAAFLERLQGRPEAEQFVLGGYFALQHYLDYRETGDVDAWWRSREDPRALAAAREAFMHTAVQFGYTVRERTWGETISLEAFNGSNKAFSFQISTRTVEIAPPLASPWGHFGIETLDDNVASKMMALVARGAPRDFVDIKALVDAGLVTVERCWELWNAKRSGIEIEDARLRVKMHLATIEARRPIERIPAADRPAAQRLRSWYREVFTTDHGDLDPGIADHGDEQQRQ